MSMSPVIGDLTCLMSRYLYHAIDQRSKWDSFFKLDCFDAVRVELDFWFKNLKTFSSKSLGSYALPKTVDYSDASNIAAGAFIVGFNDHVFHHMWNDHEILISSTWRELKAILYAIRSFKFILNNERIIWHTDNKNCEPIVKKGSTKEHLQVIALKIFQICYQFNI